MLGFGRTCRQGPDVWLTGDLDRSGAAKMIEGIRAVVFDLDGTILDRRRSFELFVREQWRRFADRLCPIDQAHYVRLAIERDGDGYAPRKELFGGIVAAFGLPSVLGDELLRDYRAEFPGACVLFADAGRTLASLRAGGFKLGLITNGSVRMQSAKLGWLGLMPVFDVALISDAEGVSKPDPKIFHRALERLGTEPGQSVFVGDHPTVDIAGARGAGMKVVWRRDPAVSDVVEADAVIDDLGELLAVVGLAGHRRDT